MEHYSYTQHSTSNLNRAQTAINNKLYRDALSILERDKKIASNLVYFYILKAYCHLKLKEHQECFNVIHTGLTLHPNHIWLLHIKASCHISNRDFEPAIKIYKDITNRDPKKLPFWFGYITCFTKQSKYTKAIEILTKLLNDSRFNKEDKQKFYHSFANLYRDKGDYEKALAIYDELLLNLPHNTDIMQSKATCLYFQNKIKMAQDLYQQIIHLHPKFSSAYLSYVEVLLADGNINEAHKNYEYIKNIFPQLVDIYIIYGRMLQNLGYDDEAATVFKEGLAKYPTSEKLRLADGYFFLNQGNFKAAREQFFQLVQSATLNRDIYLGYIICLSHMGEEQEVINIILKNQKTLLKYKEFLLALSISYYGMHNLENAEIYVRQALKLDEKYDSAWSQLGHIYSHKNIEKAKEYYKKACDYNPARLNKYKIFLESNIITPEQWNKDILVEVREEFLSNKNKKTHQKIQIENVSKSLYKIIKSKPAKLVSEKPYHEEEFQNKYDELLSIVSEKINFHQFGGDFPELMSSINPLLNHAEDDFNHYEYAEAFGKLNNIIKLLDAKKQTHLQSPNIIITEEQGNIQSPKIDKKVKKIKSKKPNVLKMKEEENDLLDQAIQQSRSEREQLQSNSIWQTASDCCLRFFSKNPNPKNEKQSSQYPTYKKQQ